MRILCILFLKCILTLGCWQSPVTPKCSVPSDPGLTGNVAFLVDYSPELILTANSALKAINESMSTVIPALDYHVSIYYYFCMLQNQTSAVEESFNSFRWKAFSITFTHLCCESSSYVEMCVDVESQAQLTNFCRALQQHLIGQGIPVPDWQIAQPPYHVSLATVNSDPTTVINNYNTNNKIDISIELLVLYFGEIPHFASASLTTPNGIMVLILTTVILGYFF